MEPNKENKKTIEQLAHSINILLAIIGVLLVTLFCSLFCNVVHPDFSSWFKKENIDSTAIKNALAKITAEEKIKKQNAILWSAPNTIAIADDEKGQQIKYGKELIVHTAKYLGPKGTVMQISNGMNCQNCHLEGGTKAWGNNYGAVFSTYPKYRARSGAIENVYKRVNDCIERSLNGTSIDTSSEEMQAIKSYIEWIGKDVKKGEKPKGSGIYDIAFLDRAALPAKGKFLFAQKCQSCHQANGQGLLNESKTEYIYPPLWGNNSYNIGAGLFRISRLAGYIKYNMPQGANFENPQLTDEEAWDIAAFVNSQSRPAKNLKKDWPKTEEKPVDHPFGPYADKFRELQHKLGPFKPIVQEREIQKKLKEKNKNNSKSTI
jgi:thiosulfate dehydrogenase